MELSDILHNLKIQELTPMQEAAKEAYQSAKDLVLLSPTGSGKTLAFLLPLVQTLKADIQGVQALVPVSYTHLVRRTNRYHHAASKYCCQVYPN